ncbi:glutathione S-transferase alpha-4-like isoform X1 [Lytechinus pictus]|uniref:glutathione S-transferase alpha-4-like isoform X1 n=1 Tax=Lytechinus pictus TaxID=7653 RepID=UPI0030B9B750
MSKPRLTYFDGRGFAEVSRLALSAAKIEYDDIYLRTRDEFLQLITDGKLMFKQVPLLEIDGQNLIGSECILRYICNKGNLQGKPEDQTKIEMLSMGARDMLKAGFSGAKFQATPEKEEEMLQNAGKQSKERYLPVFEKVLGESKSGFLVGDSLTMADLMFFDSVSYVNDLSQIQPLLADFPNCKRFIEHFSSQPGIKEYLASPRRHPPPSDEYVQGVRKVLSPPSS